MRIETNQSQPLVASKPAPPPPPPPAPEEPKQQAGTPTAVRDQVTVSQGPASNAKLPDQKKTEKKDEFNPLDAKDSPGRTAADVGSNVATGVEVARDARGIAGVASTVGSKVSILSRLGSGVAKFANKAADVGAKIATKAPMLGRLFGGVAKAAPAIGVVMAGLDIGRAALEKDPEKKREAKGTAALSTVSAAAGLAGAALLAPPATPVGVALIGVGVATSVFSFVDTTFFKGAASKKIGDAVDWVADKGKQVGEAIGGAAKKVGKFFSSL